MKNDDRIPVLSSFQQVSPPTQKTTNCKTPPFSLRLTEDERAYLNQKAGKQPLGAYIRDQLLGDDIHAKRRSLRQPKINDTQYATLLAMLGESRLASNLNQLAKHANCGTLDVSEDIEAELQSACAAVIAMRNMLFTALGHRLPKTEDEQ